MSADITIDELARALIDDEFVFHYQPKVSMVTGKVCGCEALIRWQRTDGELVSPGRFLPLEETTGIISQITISMLGKLFQDATILRDLDSELTVSFNVSAKDLMTDALVDGIQISTSTHDITPSAIQVEITESAMLESSKKTIANLERLKGLGISLAMDDFGTGFSSLDMLSKWPFSSVKLDQGVISRMQGSEKNRTIVEACIRMAHDLDLEIVAEGVETEDIYLFLQNSGCTVAQGYWIGRPMPLEDFLTFIASGKPWPALPIGLFYLAQLDHIHWRKQLIERIHFGRTAGAKSKGEFWREPELDHRQCKLGQWYYGEGRRHKGVAWYDELEAPHKELHEVGKALIEIATNGAQQSELVPLMRKLSQLSAQLINNLQELENAELAEIDKENPHLAQIIGTKSLS